MCENCEQLLRSAAASFEAKSRELHDRGIELDAATSKRANGRKVNVWSGRNHFKIRAKQFRKAADFLKKVSKDRQAGGRRSAMKLVEKMARAMVDIGLGQKGCFDRLSSDSSIRAVYMRQALAALRAMREPPSEAILDAMNGHPQCVSHAWVAAIDTAIQEAEAK